MKKKTIKNYERVKKDEREKEREYKSCLSPRRET